MAKQCLRERLEVFTGERAEDFASLATVVDENWGVVFPTQTSLPLEHCEKALPTNWIIIDGTWRKARKILHSNPWLQRIPAYHFASPPPSRYCIRKVPGQDSLSTIEAIHYLLQRTDPGCQPASLLKALEAMVKGWLAHVPVEHRTRYQR